jgi:hypothetical protein
MPTVNEVLGGLLQNAIDNPQSTIQGILTSVYGITTTLMMGQVLSARVSGIIVGMNTVAKLLLSMYQKDPK